MSKDETTIDPAIERAKRALEVLSAGRSDCDLETLSGRRNVVLVVRDALEVERLQKIESAAKLLVNHIYEFDGHPAYSPVSTKCIQSVDKQALGTTAQGKSQGLCETTLTERFRYDDCTCETYPGNLGPCATFEEGADPDRCVYCDHVVECHAAVQWLQEPING